MSGLLAAGWMLLAAYVILLLTLSVIISVKNMVASAFRAIAGFQQQEVDKK